MTWNWHEVEEPKLHNAINVLTLHYFLVCELEKKCLFTIGRVIIGTTWNVKGLELKSVNWEKHLRELYYKLDSLVSLGCLFVEKHRKPTTMGFFLFSFYSCYGYQPALWTIPKTRTLQTLTPVSYTWQEGSTNTVNKLFSPQKFYMCSI